MRNVKFRHRWQYWISIGLTICIILSIILPFYFNSTQQENDIINKFYQNKVDGIIHNIESDVIILVNKFKDLATSFASYQHFSNVTKELFDFLAPNSTDLFTITYVPYVSYNDRPLFESFTSQQLNKSITVDNTFPNRSRYMAPIKDFYVPVAYTNFPSPAHGIDLYSTPDRKSLIDITINQQIGALSQLGLFLTPTAEVNILVCLMPLIGLDDKYYGVLGYVLFVDSLFSEIVNSSINDNLIDVSLYVNEELIYTTKVNNDNDNEITKMSSFLNKQFTIKITKKSEFDKELKNNSKDVMLIIAISLMFVCCIGISYIFYQHEQNEKIIIQNTKVATERAYTRVLSYVCHEIRNPLHIIGSILSLIKYNDNVITLTDDLYGDLLSQNHRIKSIVDEVLSVQKLIEGKMTISYQLLNVIDLCHQLKSHQILNCSKNIVINLRANQSLIDNPIIYTDQLRISQIILNGLTNAIKFTKSGEISIELYLFNMSGNNTLSIKIKNTGVGLGNLNINTLFVPFSQGLIEDTNKTTNNMFLDETASDINEKLKHKMRQITSSNLELIESSPGIVAGEIELGQQRGSGLGLPISRKISILLGGYLDLYDDNNYTVYHSIINITKPQNLINIQLTPKNIINVEGVNPINKQLQPTDYKSKDIKVLLVDDDLSNLKVGQLLLNKLGYQTDTKEDGLFINMNTVNQYHVILMDINMKHSTGHQIVSKLINKKYEGFVIATTGGSTQEDIEKYKKSEFNGVLLKPFDIETLSQFLRELLTTGNWIISN